MGTFCTPYGEDRYLATELTQRPVGPGAAACRSAGGLADTSLHDQQGPIGRAAQALFVERR